jgi:GTP-binding protein
MSPEMESILLIKTAKFVKSSQTINSCPKPVYREFAFAGRSNVGKSSLINFLANRRHLARTSSSPGKTLLINHYLLNEQFYFVDLPGYGYARTSGKEREKIVALIFDYLKNRTSLSCLFLLLDPRMEPLENDRLVIQWLGEEEIPFVIVFTKTDKLTAVRLNKNLEKYRSELLTSWEVLPQFFLTSSQNRKGREEILDFISSTGNLIT